MMIWDPTREFSVGLFVTFVTGAAVASIATSTDTHNDPHDWLVYSLSSAGGGGSTWMSLWLNDTSLGPEVPSSLASFTVCVWFKPATFLDFDTLLSYSVASDHLSRGIIVRIHPKRMLINYMDEMLSVTLSSPLVALWWHSTCLVGLPGGVSVWVDGVIQGNWNITSPLPLNGFLVLGQDMEVVDGGSYMDEYSFLGEVTGLSLWNVTLTPHHLRDWASCSVPPVAPLLPWGALSWVIHNRTGDVTRRGRGPCKRDAISKGELFLFSEKRTWEDAEEFLSLVRLEMVVPRSEEDVQAVSALLERNWVQCSPGSLKNPASWLGIKLNSATGKIVDNEGREVQELTVNRKIKRKPHSNYIMQNVRGQWEMLNANAKLCFIGRQLVKKGVFRLRGICEMDHSDLFSNISTSFVLAADEEGGVYLHGYKHMYIKRDSNSSQWCLRLDDEDGAVACVTSELPPFAYHHWTFRKKVCDASINQREKLVLTFCTEKQFTCSDSSCIDLEKRCDLNFDCRDNSDETDCITALLPNTYLHSLPPDIPLTVMAEVLVMKMTTFDIVSMTYHVNLDLKFRWYDSRITFAHLGSVNSRAVVTETDKMVWQPQFVVTNSPDHANVLTILEVERYNSGRPSLKGYLYEGLRNPLVMTVSVKSTFYCDFQLRWYPWDDQLCFINLKVNNVASAGLTVRSESTVKLCPEMLEEYQVVECRLREETQATNNLTLLFYLSRRYQYHLWTTFLPTFLLLVLGYGTLLLPLDSFAERGPMSLTTLLMFIALYTETSSSLPSTAYLKHIDVWFLFGLIYLSLIIIIHMATFFTDSKSEVASSSRVGRIGWPMQSFATERVKDRPVVPKWILRASTVIFALVFVMFSLVYFLSIF